MPFFSPWGRSGIVAVRVRGNKESGQMDLKKDFYILKLLHLLLP